MTDFYGFYGPPFTFPPYPNAHHQVYGSGGPDVYYTNRDTYFAGIGAGLIGFPYESTPDGNHEQVWGFGGMESNMINGSVAEAGLGLGLIGMPYA